MLVPIYIAPLPRILIVGAIDVTTQGLDRKTAVNRLLYKLTAMASKYSRIGE